MPNTTIPSEIQTVDVQLDTLVLDAAQARIQVIREEERVNFGRGHTQLADIARRILTNWPLQEHPRKPQSARRPRYTRSVEDTCPYCGKTVSVNANGYLRRHGPEDDRCAGENYRSPKRLTNPAPVTRPFRFDMPRARYAEIKKIIHQHGYTVAGVLTEEFKTFARTSRIDQG